MARATLTLRTLELLCKVPDQVARTELMLAAQREGWNARMFADEVMAKAEELTAPPSGRGRPRLAAGERSLRGLVRQAAAYAPPTTM